MEHIDVKHIKEILKEQLDIYIKAKDAILDRIKRYEADLVIFDKKIKKCEKLIIEIDKATV